MSSVEEVSASAQEDFDIEDLADIVASMSRFLTRFAGTPPLRKPISVSPSGSAS